MLLISRHNVRGNTQVLKVCHVLWVGLCAIWLFRCVALAVRTMCSLRKVRKWRILGSAPARSINKTYSKSKAGRREIDRVRPGNTRINRYQQCRQSTMARMVLLTLKNSPHPCHSENSAHKLLLSRRLWQIHIC